MREVIPAAAALLFAWGAARAQAAGDSSRQALTVSLGLVHEDRRDAADSPLAYGGSGPGARVGYEWARAGRTGYVALTGGGATLTPLSPVPRPDIPLQEAFSVYSAEGGMAWRIARRAGARDAFTLGVEAAATVTLARHTYPGQELNQQNFDLGVLTLAPRGRWTRRAGAGEITASLAVPLLAWVDHPYADVRFAQQLANVHYAPLSQFHQANGDLSYAFRPGSRVGITATYRIDVVELDDVEPVRRVSQSLSIGVVRRFGLHP
jgi:hypothetical protein